MGLLSGIGDGEHNGNGHAGEASTASLGRRRRVGALAQQKKGAQMAFEVPPLPYDYDALEPHIDEATMRVHHDKHHQAYVDKANAALEGTEWDGKPVEEVLQNLSSLPEDKQGVFRNNGGGHANHTLFW